MSDYSNLIQSIVEGNYAKCVELTNEALDEGASPQDIVSSGLQAVSSPKSSSCSTSVSLTEWKIWPGYLSTQFLLGGINR